MKATVLYEDGHLLALHKPPHQIVIPGRGSDIGPTLLSEVETYLQGKAFVVHRLDRETSGLILFAKTAEAHRHFSIQFEQRKVKKTYLAAVLGRIEEARGEIHRPIRAFGSGRMGCDPKGQASKTIYETLERFKDASLLSITPETGRRHQIRVHLYALGHPVLGDPLYGSPRPVGGFERMMLHALSLQIPHPDGHLLDLRAEVDSDWSAIFSSSAAFQRSI